MTQVNVKNISPDDSILVKYAQIGSWYVVISNTINEEYNGKIGIIFHRDLGDGPHNCLVLQDGITVSSNSLKLKKINKLTMNYEV